MLKTRITEQYRLKVPFINAGMAFIATAPLVRAVCNAGGMGMLGIPANQRYSNEELVISEIGQVGTQFDGFTHQAIDRLLYNCIKMDEIVTRNGFTKLGME